MRKLLLFIFLLLSFSGYAQEYEWVKFYQGYSTQFPVSLSVDKTGNQYATFNFYRDFEFDSTKITQNNNNQHGLVIKQDATGKTLWYRVIEPLGTTLYTAKSMFNSNGNLLVFVASPNSIVVDKDTIQRQGTNNYALYLIEFNDTGKVVYSKHLIEGNLGGFTYAQNKIFSDDDDNIYLGLVYNGDVKVYDSTGTVTLSGTTSRNIVFKFSPSGGKLEWTRVFPHSPIWMNSLKADINQNVYVATYWGGISSFVFNGSSISNPFTTGTGTVFILDRDGNDKNWFYIEGSGKRSTVYDIAVHDTNSVFISGAYLGDSARFDTLWEKNKKFGVYNFFAKYKANGSLAWVKVEDTTYSTNLFYPNYHGSMTSHLDQYFYLSTYCPYHFSRPFSYDSQKYGQNVNGYGFNTKVDDRGNILWGFKTDYPFIGMGTDQNNNFYFQGWWINDSINFGKFNAYANGYDAFIGKTFDYAIIRGDVKSGPYCAGDTLLIPYTKLGNYSDSNYFIAELSDEYGNFTGTERELGRIQSSDSGTIIGILPLFEVASSDLYRIRIRSTSPQVQSFYREDTLNLLIYSRDKADPGPPELVCYGDSFQLRTFGGTAWEWSPAYNMDDSTSRTPFIIPDKDTIYRIVISDSSGCGEADTAFKQIFVRDNPKLNTADSVVTCHNIDAELIAQFESGDTTGYHWNWYVIDSLNQWQWLKTDSFKLSDTLYYKLPEDIITYQTLVIVLDDGCSVVKDTTFIRLYLTSENMSSEILTLDSIACYNSIQSLTAQFIGGDPGTYTWQWFEVVSDSQFNLLKSDSFALNDTLIVQPGTDIFEYQRYALISKDECTPFIDTSYYTVYIDQSRPEALLFPQDSAICPGTSIDLRSQFDSGSTLGYNWLWINQSGQILMRDTGYYSVNFETIPQFTNQAKQTFHLILSDNCSPYKDTASLDIYPREPIAVLATPQDTLLCAGQEVTFSATGTGGVPEYYQFRWEDAETGALLGEEETLNIITSTTQDFRVILTDGCMPKGDSTIVTLRVNPPLEAVILSGVEGDSAGDTIICFGSELEYHARGFGGDSSGYSFNWYLNDSLISNTSSSTSTFTSVSTLTSTLTLILTDNCTSLSDTQSINIDILPPLEVSAIIPDTLCRGEEFTLTAFPSGGIPKDYQYQWLVDGTLVGTDSIITHPFTFSLSPFTQLQLILSDQCSNPNDTFTKTIIFRPELTLNLATSNPCANPSAILTATPQGGKSEDYSIQWFDAANNLLGEEFSLNVTPIGVQTYTAILNDGCTEKADTATITIGSVPEIEVTVNPNEGCEPLPVTFEIKTNYPDGYTWSLNPGDGNPYNNLRQTQLSVVFPTGTYYPMASITTDFGCSNNFDNLFFEVFPKPQAYFTFHPESPSLDSPLVSFKNLSVGALHYFWSIEPVGNFDEFEPNVTYPDTGLYHITLIAETDKGCLDTFSSSLRVLPQYHVYLPSAFSPNGDGLNDNFRPVVAGVAEMSFQVFNRWGQMVFMGKNNDTWDGTFNGKPVPEGIYVYSVQVLNMLGEKQSFSGSLTVLR